MNIKDTEIDDICAVICSDYPCDYRKACNPEIVCRDAFGMTIDIINGYEKAILAKFGDIAFDEIRAKVLSASLGKKAPLFYHDRPAINCQKVHG